jgi:hypothetical protein
MRACAFIFKACVLRFQCRCLGAGHAFNPPVTASFELDRHWDVVNLAGLWSIDPSQLSDQDHPPGLGLAARLPDDLRQ